MAISGLGLLTEVKDADLHSVQSKNHEHKLLQAADSVQHTESSQHSSYKANTNASRIHSRCLLVHEHTHEVALHCLHGASLQVVARHFVQGFCQMVPDKGLHLV